MPMPTEVPLQTWPAAVIVAVYTIDRLTKLVRYAYQRNNGGTPDQRALVVQKEINRKQELILTELRSLNDKHQTRAQLCAYEEHHEHIRATLDRLERKS